MRPQLVVGLLALGVVLPAPASGQGVEAEVRDLTWVGFQQLEEASRVFVRTNEKVQYRIDTSRDGLIVLVLENTRVPVFNNTRALDTRFFEGPVRWVAAKPIEGPSPSVQVEIRLRRRGPYNVSQADAVVAIDFNR